MNKLLITISTLLFLLGCKSFENSSEVPKDVTYEISHKQELSFKGGLVTGMVYSKNHDGLWMQTKTENEPYLYLVNPETGKQKDKVFVRGTSFGWQGISFHSNDIKIGDIGDPLKERDNIQIYSIDESNIEDHFAVPFIQTFEYPNLKKDAKALVFHPKSKMYYIFTFNDDKTEVYSISSRVNKGTLTKVTELDFKNVTDVHLSQDLKQILVVTRNEVYVYNTSTNRNIITVLSEDEPLYTKELNQCVYKSACFFGDNNDICLLVYNPIQEKAYYTIERRVGQY